MEEIRACIQCKLPIVPRPGDDPSKCPACGSEMNSILAYSPDELTPHGREVQKLLNPREKGVEF